MRLFSLFYPFPVHPGYLPPSTSFVPFISPSFPSSVHSSVSFFPFVLSFPSLSSFKFHSHHHFLSSLSSRPLILTSHVLFSFVRIFLFSSLAQSLTPSRHPSLLIFPRPVVFTSTFLLLSVQLSIFLPF